MKAPASENEQKDVGAEPKDFDWAVFCSRLRYYYGIDNEEINSHSRAYLMLMYENYYGLACENLGVSPNEDERDEAAGKTNSKGNKVLAENSYPIELYPKAKMQEETKPNDFIDQYLKDFKGVICDG